MAPEQLSGPSSYRPLSLKSTKSNEDKPWKIQLIYLQCYFISIACILGTGILGLPGKVAHAGLQPFLVSFVIGFFMQALLIYLFVDLLQRCHSAQLEAVKHFMVERIQMHDVGAQDPVPSSIEEEEEEEEETEDADHVLLNQTNGVNCSEKEHVPNLHILGFLFLNKYLSSVFNILLILQFISIGISYVLAGSEAFAELLQIRCWAVLNIVPQTSIRKILYDKHLNISIPGYIIVYSNISLEASEKAGEIATVPLTKIIMEQYRKFAWVAWFTEIFITISITVSFLVIGSSMKHALDGWVASFWNRKCKNASKQGEKSCLQLFKINNLKSVTQGLVCLLGFGIIFLVALSNPKGFVVLLDKVTSFALNLEAGLFIFLMVRNARSEPYTHLTVPLPVSPRIFLLHWLLPVYFLFAVGYDICQSLTLLAHGWHPMHLLSNNSTNA
ncbi:uncharacterized protein [Hemitrygon akajei]|uniref:uncharacterized protein isoform X7 n=1 Tax=Hemitrygon akajei TaxID=2704970 RepID=UPI003BFA0C85